MQQDRTEDLLGHIEEPNLDGAARVFPQSLDCKRRDSKQAQRALYKQRKVTEKVAFALAIFSFEWVFACSARDVGDLSGWCCECNGARCFGGRCRHGGLAALWRSSFIIVSRRRLARQDRLVAMMRLIDGISFHAFDPKKLGFEDCPLLA